MPTLPPKNITFIVSDMSKMIALEWICDYRNKSLTNLSFIFLNKGNSEIEEFVQTRGYIFKRITYNGKKDLIKALWQTFYFLRKNKSDIIHCHLFDACLVGLTAGLFAGIKKRIYTRHYATYHHQYFPKAVKYDKIINFLATDIVAISQLVKNVLVDLESVKPEKIHLINHGFLMEEYAVVSEDRIKSFKAKYCINEGDLIIGVVARYTLLKGIQFIIPAFIKLLKNYPNARLLIANSHGNDEIYLRSLLSDIPDRNLIEVKYERDMGALYKSLDIYVHVPIFDHIEAFGQTYVEALMAGVPSVFTLSGIAQEFIVHEKNALVVPFQDAQSIFAVLDRLIKDRELYSRVSAQGAIDVKNLFDLPLMINRLESLYLH